MAWHGSARIARRERGRTAVAALLTITLCYGPLFWGMRHVDSGTAAVLELGLMPVALPGFALLLREERFAWIKLVEIGLDLGGVGVPRPLLPTYQSALVAGSTTRIGGIARLALSFAFEPGSVRALRGNWGWAAWRGAP